MEGKGSRSCKEAKPQQVRQKQPGQLGQVCSRRSAPAVALLGVLAALGVLVLKPSAVAQPNLKPPAEERPPVWDTLTPQQRHEYKQKMFAKSLRQSLDEDGFRGTTLQEAILSFVRRREDSCQILRDKAQKLDALLKAGAEEIDIQKAATDFQTAVAAEKKQRDEELLDLDKAISYSTKPRLFAWLLSRGVISDDYSYLLNRALYIKPEIPKAIIYN